MGKGLRRKGSADPYTHAPRWLPPAPLDVIKRITRQNALDPRLLPCDRHMQRWAVGQGTGLPNDERALYPRTNLTPLPQAEAIITDKVVLAAPGYWRRFVVLWYRSDCSVDQLREELGGISRDRVFDERRLVLAYLLGRLTSVGIRVALFEPGA